MFKLSTKGQETWDASSSRTLETQHYGISPLNMVLNNTENVLNF